MQAWKKTIELYASKLIIKHSEDKLKYLVSCSRYQFSILQLAACLIIRSYPVVAGLIHIDGYSMKGVKAFLIMGFEGASLNQFLLKRQKCSATKIRVANGMQRKSPTFPLPRLDCNQL
jgi:hypothetical protein